MQLYFSFSFGFHPTQEFFKLYLEFQKTKKKEGNKKRRQAFIQTGFLQS